MSIPTIPPTIHTQRGVETPFDGVRIVPTAYTLAAHPQLPWTYRWLTEEKRFIPYGIQNLPSFGRERTPVCCINCRKVLAYATDHRYLHVGGWIFTGRVGIICPECRKMRRWQPAFPRND